MSWNLIAQIEAGDHILDAPEVEGPVRLALVADLQQNAEPVFALRLATGEPVHLVSHDGCGFIRESLARQIPAMAQAMEERARAHPSADTPYAGLNVIVRSAAGRDFEMPFHTEDSLRARDTGHRAYRTWQDQEMQARLEQEPAKRLSLQ
ncbi:hypothetical protein LBM2029_20155 (plasmid) [Ralstonia solanacearum]|nr:hypothetical protein [Ralstonia solanacearum]AMP39895.1 hypothetical protein LBM2029_20155 [Ralstonia solanacearum]